MENGQKQELIKQETKATIRWHTNSPRDGRRSVYLPENHQKVSHFAESLLKTHYYKIDKNFEISGILHKKI